MVDLWSLSGATAIGFCMVVTHIFALYLNCEHPLAVSVQSASSVFQRLECRCLSLALFTIPGELGYLASAIYNHSVILLFLIVRPFACDLEFFLQREDISQLFYHNCSLCLNFSSAMLLSLVHRKWKKATECHFQASAGLSHLSLLPRPALSPTEHFLA